MIWMIPGIIIILFALMLYDKFSEEEEEERFSIYDDEFKDR